jgi:hypothetical protein
MGDTRLSEVLLEFSFCPSGGFPSRAENTELLHLPLRPIAIGRHGRPNSELRISAPMRTSSRTKRICGLFPRERIAYADKKSKNGEK